MFGHGLACPVLPVGARQHTMAFALQPDGLGFANVPRIR